MTVVTSRFGTQPDPKPIRHPVQRRQENRPCAHCGKPIRPGHMYLVNGPAHIGCPTRAVR